MKKAIIMLLSLLLFTAACKAAPQAQAPQQTAKQSQAEQQIKALEQAPTPTPAPVADYMPLQYQNREAFFAGVRAEKAAQSAGKKTAGEKPSLTEEYKVREITFYADFAKEVQKQVSLESISVKEAYIALTFLPFSGQPKGEQPLVLEYTRVNYEIPHLEHVRSIYTNVAINPLTIRGNDALCIDLGNGTLYYYWEEAGMRLFAGVPPWAQKLFSNQEYLSVVKTEIPPA